MGIFGALGNIVGGLIGREDEKNAQGDARKFTKKQEERAREYFLADRTDDRRYAAGLTENDRRYGESLTARDRAYAERMLFGERDYARKITEGDRRYAEGIYAEDRRNAAADKRTDRRVYQTDRARLQRLADSQAERTTASRGIDFTRLREDAAKAGFNPLTAMQWASAYNTETGYGVMGDAYSGSSAGAARGGAGGSTTAAAGSPIGSTMVGSINPGSNGFQTPGNGYTSPSLSSSSFISAGLGELLDTGFNEWNHRDDETYARIADQVAAGQLAREYERSTPRNFGYNLSKVEPFRPSIGVSVAPFRPDGQELSPSDSTMTPSVRGMPTPWGDLMPSGDVPDQEAVETRYGGGVGELVGAGAFIRDMWKGGPGRGAGYDWAKRSFDKYAKGLGTGPRVKPGTGSFALTGAYPIAPLWQSMGGL